MITCYQQYLMQNKVEFLSRRTRVREKLHEQFDLLRRCGSDHHRKLELGKGIWKILFECAMSYIDPDRRGYDRLFNYVDDYAEFEELMFASDPFYRDHTLHSLWVYLVSEYLHREPLFDSFYDPLKPLVNWGSPPESLNALEVLGYTMEHAPLDVFRCVAALCHDLGYPIKKIGKINKAMSRILPYFSINRHQEFLVEYTAVQKDFLDGLVQMMSSDIVFCDESLQICSRYGIEEPLSEDGARQLRRLSEQELDALRGELEIRHRILENRQARLRLLRNVEEYDHGFMSCYLLARNLPAFTSGVLYAVESGQSVPQVEKLACKMYMLNAMAAHSSSTLKIRAFDHPETLLILPDELEEFSRISRASQNRQYVNEFCTSRLRMDGDVLVMDFIFDRGDPDVLRPELFFRGKSERFLNLFDIPRLDPNLNVQMNCQDRLRAEHSRDYTLAISRDYVAMEVKGEFVSPAEYLQSPQLRQYQ